MNLTKPKKIKKINEKTLIVAIDIGKRFHHGYFRAPSGEEIKPFVFFNSGDSYKELWRKIVQFKSQQQLEDIVVGFESTGPYAEPLFQYLRNKPIKLVQVNPMHTKRVKELTGNSPNKTDKKDPRVIADVISLGHALTLVIPEGPAAQLRRLIHARERSIKDRTAMKNQLQNLMFVVFPEFLDIINDISTKSAMYLIKHHPSPESIATIGLEALSDKLRKVSRGQLRKERAEKLFRAAQSSVGIQEGKEGIFFEIAHLVSKIEQENRFIDHMETQIQQYLQQIPYAFNILTIKGIGIITTAGLIGEVGDFKKFHTIAEITKLAGLDLFEMSSGKHKGQRRISKRGRSLMRKLLFYAAVNVVKSNGIMHKRYHRMLDRGMPKMKALIAVSRRVLALIFAIVRDNTEYIENYSRHHYKLAA